MKYDDLLNTPFKWGGRDKSGLDCWGLVVECCKRAGTPVADPFKAREDSGMPADEVAACIAQKLNVREIDAPKPGAILYTKIGAANHTGYLISKREVLHTLNDKGVKVSPLAAFPRARFFEVV